MRFDSFAAPDLRRECGIIPLQICAHPIIIIDYKPPAGCVRICLGSMPPQAQIRRSKRQRTAPAAQDNSVLPGNPWRETVFCAAGAVFSIPGAAASCFQLFGLTIFIVAPVMVRSLNSFHFAYLGFSTTVPFSPCSGYSSTESALMIISPRRSRNSFAVWISS